MARLVALLRGINTGGHRVKMEDLRRHFEALGLRNAATFIASGNVLFDTAARDLPALERKIEKHLEKSLGFEAATFLRTLPELQAIAERELFSDVREGDSCYVFLLREEAPAAARRALAALDSDIEQFRFAGREIYWRCRGKISEVSVAWPQLDKALRGVDCTSRNITSVRKLLAQHGAE